MSLREKIGQLAQIDIMKLIVHDENDRAILNETAVDYFIGEMGIGSVLNTVGGQPWAAQDYRHAVVILQETAKRYGRPPVIWGLDSVHGANYIYGAVVSPQPLNIAATFNTTVSFNAGALASRDTRAAGITWLFSPLLGIALEPKWSRVFETFGEDPTLVGAMAHAMTEGIQEPDTRSTVLPTRAAACAKHFIGYSMPRDGHDRSPSWIPTRHLYQYFVPTWKNLTAYTVMESYTEYDGVPNVANKNSLNYLLRERLQFDGVLVTDYEEMRNLHNWHGVTDNDVDAILASLRHGSVDMSMIPWDYAGFAQAIEQGMDKHLLDLHRIEESALRVLQLKDKLNMFDEEIVEQDANVQLVGSDAKSVLDMVHQSIVLAKNKDDFLPLKKYTDADSRPKIHVTGPTASSLVYQSGAWTGQWQGAPNDADWFTYGQTVLGALSMETEWDVSFTCGTNILGGECEDASTKEPNIVEQVEAWVGLGEHNSIGRAVSNTSDADVVIVCVGEEAATEKPGDIRSLRLPEGQYELVRQIKRKTEAKIVLVYFGGRPRLLEDMAELADAVLVAFLPGPSAGEAIADIVTGRVNPGGRLPVTYPLYEDGGGVPYFHSVSDQCTRGDGPLPHWEYSPCEVQWPFGHGLSYTSFDYSDFSASGGIDEDLHVSVSVRNTGKRSGTETVLFFTFDEFRSTTPEYKRLRAFDKVHLEPGQSVTVSKVVPLDDLRFVGPDDDKHYIIDPTMISWVGVGVETDCRTSPGDQLCKRIVSKNPEQVYVGACEAACNVWMQSGCAKTYKMSKDSCLSECTEISAFPAASMDEDNNGWGWTYVDCLESVVWGFKERDSTDQCWQMTSMCRNVFETGDLDEFGMGIAMRPSSVGGFVSTANVVALSVAAIGSLLIAYFLRGGTLKRRKSRLERHHDDTIQLTPHIPDFED
jgi:beta-glucosidase